ncbi:HAD-IIA family hydrolase [Paenibacillus harenae]|uniref:Acid sugar phosphatase n=1 Tax=Paenibacillus harenae TaxID=306543 RepID=A0ABT9U0D4_PAEHA|nr:HAD-IIA family hydrolase [Paenibacillus harenae]MDQ0112135.1 arabinose operon protein AraL [Paenibacillus harenae]
MLLEHIDGFIIDLDGTVYRGVEAIDGAKETIDALQKRNLPVVFLSNRGNISRAMCVERLGRIGIDARPEQILLTSTVTGQYLRKHAPEAKVWTLGDRGLREELAEQGVTLAMHPEEADKLVITLHENLTYSELNDAFRAARSGAEIIATNEDKSFPGENGESIDVAGMIGAIVATTGQQVQVVIGKPSQIMADAALHALGLSPERCLVIGDSIASDIALGKRAGMRTALVLSGSSTREHGENAVDRPDYIWDSLADLLIELEREELSA